MHFSKYFKHKAMISLVNEADDELKKTKFTDLLEKPLGSIPNIIFWSDQQVELINNITNTKHTLLMGDYGTGVLRIEGKNILHKEYIYPTAGKTLILEASVKILSQRENTKVFFVNALGKTLNTLSLWINNLQCTFFILWTDYYVDGRYQKKSDDILDAISRFEGISNFQNDLHTYIRICI